VPEKEKTQAEEPFALKDCWNRIGVWGDGKERCPELASVIHCRNCPVYSVQGKLLLDRPIPEEYREEWTSVLSKKIAAKESTIQSVFVFRAGSEWLALPAKLIQEVVDMGLIHSLPHRNSTILRGIVNIRGKLELCFSIGAVLGIERFEKTALRDRYVSPERLVVVAREGQRIVFPVSEVLGTFRCAEGTLQQLPVTVSGSKAAFTKGIFSVKGFDVGFLEEQILFDSLLRIFS